MTRTFHYQIPADQAGVTIGTYLKSLGYSHHIMVHLKRTPQGILLNGTWAYTNQTLKEEDLVTVHLTEETSSENIVPMPLPLQIVYEDDDLLIVNKDADTPIHPSQNHYDNTLANAVAYYYQQKEQPFVYRCINRLDRDTTGVLILAKHALSAAILSEMMRKRQIHRTYRALVEGITDEEGTIDAPIGRVEGSTIERCVDWEHGEHAVTHYQRISVHDTFSYIQLQLETGRTHQIRVHMTHKGHPLLGDTLYHKEHATMKRQALHSYSLAFRHPITGEEMTFTAPLPDDMRLTLSN